MTNDIQDSKSELDPTSGKPLATDEEINMILEKLAVNNQSELINQPSTKITPVTDDESEVTDDPV